MPGDMSTSVLLLVALAVFLQGMGKGGFPVGSVSLPLLMLAWPGEKAALNSVSFLLPLLCAMDVVGMLFYRKEICWDRLVRLFPGMLAGIAAGSMVLAAATAGDGHRLNAVSDRTLKLVVGILGIGFVLISAGKAWLLRRLEAAPPPGWSKSTGFGIVAGLTSTIAHAAGPVLQMYLLPQKLPKLKFAGTNTAFFFVANAVKLLPYFLLGMIDRKGLSLGLWMLPVIPVGVAAGYGLVRLMKSRHYEGFIYVILLLTSLLLIVKAAGIV